MPRRSPRPGYVGEDVENILLKLIQAADYDVKKAETGIIYIDEIDKIARKSENPSITRDVSRRGRAAGAAEDPRGHHRRVPPQGGRKHPHQEFIQIDTTNILFICGGAFAGLDKIIDSRIGSHGVGFGADVRRSDEKDMGEVLGKLLPEDLLKYGLIPEFVGRLPVLTNVHQLDKGALVEILTEPKNALVKQYRKFFEFDGVELEFNEEALEAIADQAILRGTGARGLRAIMEEVLLNVMYDLPSRQDVNKCLVDRDVVLSASTPRWFRSRSPASAANAPLSSTSTRPVRWSVASCPRSISVLASARGEASSPIDPSSPRGCARGRGGGRVHLGRRGDAVEHSYGVDRRRGSGRAHRDGVQHRVRGRDGRLRQHPPCDPDGRRRRRRAGGGLRQHRQGRRGARLALLRRRAAARVTVAPAASAGCGRAVHVRRGPARTGRCHRQRAPSFLPVRPAEGAARA